MKWGLRQFVTAEAFETIGADLEHAAKQKLIDFLSVRGLHPVAAPETKWLRVCGLAAAERQVLPGSARDDDYELRVWVRTK